MPLDNFSEYSTSKTLADVLITGISANNEDYSEVHELERKSRINILGGTHYSTEKFACQKMCTYFEKLGLVSAFIEGEPVYEDMLAYYVIKSD